MRSNKANRGRTFEKFVELAGYIGQRKGLILFQRTPPEMKIIKGIGGGKFISVFSGYGPPDYMVIDQSHVVFADAKEFSGKRFSFSHIRKHQADFFSELEDINKSGVGALLLRADHSRQWIVPWSRIRKKYELWESARMVKTSVSPGGASLSMDEIEKLGVRFDSDNFAEILYGICVTATEERFMAGIYKEAE